MVLWLRFSEIFEKAKWIFEDEEAWYLWSTDLLHTLETHDTPDDATDGWLEEINCLTSEAPPIIYWMSNAGLKIDPVVLQYWWKIAAVRI